MVLLKQWFRCLWCYERYCCVVVIVVCDFCWLLVGLLCVFCLFDYVVMVASWCLTAVVSLRIDGLVLLFVVAVIGG